MCSIIVALCTTMLLFHGVSCHLFPQAILGQVGASKVNKRQIDDDNMLLQCALERFNTFYQGNNSNIVSQCRTILTSGLDFVSEDASAFIDFDTLCVPDCGNVVIDVFVACGSSREDGNAVAALCGSNDNGDTCYELLPGSIDLLGNALSCSAGTGCDCASISEEVRRQGCCIVSVNDNINRLDDSVFGEDFDLNEVYDNCNVNVPESECNNSPLSGSGSLRTSYINMSGTTILFVILVNNFIGFDMM